MGVYVPAMSFEEELAEHEEQDEEIYRLRRELSLLSKMHREVSVMYYVKNMSCSEIAKAQNISIEMVKYHLFKTRKLLKCPRVQLKITKLVLGQRSSFRI